MIVLSPAMAMMGWTVAAEAWGLPPIFSPLSLVLSVVRSPPKLFRGYDTFLDHLNGSTLDDTERLTLPWNDLKSSVAHAGPRRRRKEPHLHELVAAAATS